MSSRTLTQSSSTLIQDKENMPYGNGDVSGGEDAGRSRGTAAINGKGKGKARADEIELDDADEEQEDAMQLDGEADERDGGRGEPDGEDEDEGDSADDDEETRQRKAEKKAERRRALRTQYRNLQHVVDGTLSRSLASFADGCSFEVSFR